MDSVLTGLCIDSTKVDFFCSITRKNNFISQKVVY